uniref:homocysteine S-methyltransferase family protein n=1 Tax=Adlercreutzia sp. ZJ473 TaxID=2722822 RepID=UPI0015563A75
MPDIKLRLNKDMLVLSTPVLSTLARLGIDVERDVEFTLLLEPDTLEDAYKLESIAGAQCLVAATASVTPARLARAGMEDRAAEVVSAALGAVRAQVPQHVLAEIGPCGLPLDASSKASLRENRDQYARAGRLFAQEEFDAFFLNGFATCDDLKCALMGLRKVSDAPVFASVDVAADGTLRSGRGTLEEAVAIMEELEVSVAGFATGAPQEAAVDLARRAAGATALPLLAQLEVRERNARQQGPTPENPYYAPDAMVAAADALRAAGVQFLRAVGDATPAYSGALVATTMGLDAVVRESAEGE